jgi:hypothetical protein
MDGFTLSIEDLKKMEIPKSPQKPPRGLTCAIISKSPERRVKNGKMISMTISNEDSTSYMRAVCFNLQLFELLEVRKTYHFKSFKYQQGYGNRSKDIEVVLGDNSEKEISPKQFDIKQVWLNIASTLKCDTDEKPFVNVKGKVTEMEEPYTVGSPPKMKRNIFLSDATASMSIALWKDQATSPDLNTGDVISVQNLSLSKWNGTITGNASPETTFAIISESIEINEAALPQPNKVIASNTRIKALKKYTTIPKCCNDYANDNNAYYFFW